MRATLLVALVALILAVPEALAQRGPGRPGGPGRPIRPGGPGRLCRRGNCPTQWFAAEDGDTECSLDDDPELFDIRDDPPNENLCEDTETEVCACFVLADGTLKDAEPVCDVCSYRWRIFG